MLSRGQSRRLQKRFALLDAELNQRLGLFAIAALVVLVMVGLLPDRAGAPEWLSRTLGVAYAIAILPAFAWFYAWAAQKLARQHGLECSRCGGSLRKLLLRKVLSRQRQDDPDYSLDGQVPLRCPYCHTSIDVATAPAATKEQASR